MSLPLNVKRLRGNFIERMQERIAKWAQAKMGARIEVPVELEWWYWNEFGTATKFGGAPEGLPGALNMAPAGPDARYPILPVNANMLRFPLNGQIVLRASVMHPGIKPSRSVSKVIQEIVDNACSAVAAAFRQGGADRPEIVAAAIVATTEQAKELIAQSISSNLTQTREDGKLDGRDPGEVFSASATVVDLSR
jgi:hypothetical protein